MGQVQKDQALQVTDMQPMVWVDLHVYRYQRTLFPSPSIALYSSPCVSHSHFTG